MAHTTVKTIIANPARKGKRMARAKRRLTLKQRLHFGSKAQRSAAKRSLSGKRKAHRKRSNPARKRVAAPRKRRAVARKRVHRTRKRAVRRRSNPGEIISLALNPAKRRKKAVARTKRRKTARRRVNAGHRATRKTTRRRSVRRNPGQVGGLLKTGLAVIGGAVGSKVGAQMVLGAKNVGVFGYLANAAAGGVLAWGAKQFLKDRAISQGIVIGTVVQIITRAIGDFTPYGSFLAGQGMGDYMVQNFVTPQRLGDGLNSPQVMNPGGVWGPTMIAAPAGMGSVFGGGESLYG